MSAAPDFEAHQLLVLYRDRIRELLGEHAMTSPRIVGFAGMKRHLPAGAVVEMLVDVADVHDWYAVDAHRVADQIGDLLGYPISLTHCPVGNERLVEGEQMWSLEPCPESLIRSDASPKRTTSTDWRRITRPEPGNVADARVLADNPRLPRDPTTPQATSDLDEIVRHVVAMWMLSPVPERIFETMTAPLGTASTIPLAPSAKCVSEGWLIRL